MYSTFTIKNPEGAACTNLTLRSLGTLQGIFSAEIDRSGGRIEIAHTEEISRTEIAALLLQNGYNIDEEENDEPYDAPSIWGCAL